MKMTFCSNDSNSIQINTFNRYDSLISLDFDDIITAVKSNEKEYTEEAINRVFNEILKTALEDARYELKDKMNDILKALG